MRKLGCDTAPPECPWRAFQEPTVARVAKLRRSMDAGMGLPPLSHRVRDALRLYSRLLDDVSAERRRIEAEQDNPR